MISTSYSSTNLNKFLRSSMAVASDLSTFLQLQNNRWEGMHVTSGRANKAYVYIRLTSAAIYPKQGHLREVDKSWWGVFAKPLNPLYLYSKSFLIEIKQIPRVPFVLMVLFMLECSAVAATCCCCGHRLQPPPSHCDSIPLTGKFSTPSYWQVSASQKTLLLQPQMPPASAPVPNV